MIAVSATPRAMRGFSLTEMLVALVIVGLAALLFAGGIGRAGLVLDLAQRNDVRIDAVASAQFTMRQRLANAMPLRESGTGSTPIDFAGLGDRVDFIAEPADRDAPDALYYYRIARDPDGDLALYSTSTLNPRIDAHNAATLGWTAYPLVHNTAAIALSYLGRSTFAPRQGLVWQDNWAHRTDLPVAVRIRVAFPEGDPRNWPEMVVRLRAATQTPCPPEAIAGSCTPPKGTGA